MVEIQPRVQLVGHSLLQEAAQYLEVLRHRAPIEKLPPTLDQEILERTDLVHGVQRAMGLRDEAGEQKYPRETARDILFGIGLFDVDLPPAPSHEIDPLFPKRD